MTKGRAKGVMAERQVVRLLAAWWPDGEFTRTPQSGGWSTAKVRSDFRASGDVMTTSPTFPFVVEVKRREAFSWTTLLTGKQSPVHGWWEQTERAADEQHATPLLWLRHNQEPWRVMLEEELAPLIRPRFVRRVRSLIVAPAAALLATQPAEVVEAARRLRAARPR